MLLVLLLGLAGCSAVAQMQRVAKRKFDGSCTVDAVTIREPSLRSQILTSKPHPRAAELQPVCERYADYAGVNLALRIVADDTQVPYWGNVGPAPWTDWRSPRLPVDIYIRETHVAAVIEDSQAPSRSALRHEALHAKLWLETGKPDAAHTSPQWEGVIAGWKPPEESEP